MQSLTPEEAVGEGFSSCRRLREYWDHRYSEGQRWADNPWVWVTSLQPVWERFPKRKPKLTAEQSVQFELDLG